MKKKTGKTGTGKTREPSSASLREMPEVDFEGARVRINPYAARAAADAILRLKVTLVEVELRVPAHADHRFRSKPIRDSGRSRSPIPEQADR